MTSEDGGIAPNLKEAASVLYASSKFMMNKAPKGLSPMQILAQKYTAIKGTPVREAEVWDMFCSDLKEIFEECKNIKAGKNASYIPQLAKMNPDSWGVAVETVDGKKFSIGDTNVDFSIQSCSKPIVYCMACEELGPEEVHKFIGREPSGARFNAFTLNDENKPFNPYINTGAIMTCSLVQRNKDVAERFGNVQNFFKEMAGGQKIGFSNSIFLSERMTADRNKALTHFMNEHGAFPPNTNIHDGLDFYFQTCSLEVSASTLAGMAATLANGGVSPTTGKRVVSTQTVKNCLILLFSCGMYDYSGNWAFDVGLPAKSGVSGCIFIVIPNVMGICTWSPPLDFRGNSVRGIEFCKLLNDRFNFHIFSQFVQNNDPDVLRPGTRAAARNTQFEDRQSKVTLMCQAAHRGDVHELQKLIVHDHAPVNAGNYDHRTALHIAASEGHLECVQLLVTAGADVNVTDRWGGTPLDDAVHSKNENVVTFLASKGAKSNLTSDTENPSTTQSMRRKTSNNNNNEASTNGKAVSPQTSPHNGNNTNGQAAQPNGHVSPRVERHNNVSPKGAPPANPLRASESKSNGNSTNPSPQRVANGNANHSIPKQQPQQRPQQPPPQRHLSAKDNELQFPAIKPQQQLSQQAEYLTLPKPIREAP